MQQRKTLKTLTVLGGLLFGLSNAAQADCGEIKLGDFDWDSANLHTAIGAFILEKGYGCEVKITTGSTNPIMAAFYEQDLDVIMEVWYENIIDQFDPAEAAGKIRRVGVNTPDSAQGFYIDKATADAHGIKSVEDMKSPEIAALFKDPEDPSKGRMTSCISGWTCFIINAVKHKSYGLDEFYTNFDPGNSGALDAAIIGAFAKGTPVFTYYWEPTPLMGSPDIDLVKLEEPAYDADTWAAMTKVVDTVKADGIEALTLVDATAYKDAVLPIAINTRLDKDEPEVVEFLKNYTMSSAQVSSLLDHYKNEADGEADITAAHYLKTTSAWEGWVPADVATKIKAAL